MRFLFYSTGQERADRMFVGRWEGRGRRVGGSQICGNCWILPMAGIEEGFAGAFIGCAAGEGVGRRVKKRR